MTKTELLTKLTASEEIKGVAYIPLHQVIEWIKELEEGSKVDEEMVSELVGLIGADISDAGLDLIDDYSLEMNSREVELDSITLNDRELNSIIKNQLDNYFDL